MEIILKTLQETDFSQIVSWINQNPRDFIIQWAGPTYEYPLTIDQMMNHYYRGINSLESDVFIYKIMESNQFIGTFQLARFDREKKEAVVGRFLIGNPSSRGRGVGRTALQMLVRIGFNDFDLNCIRLNVYESNEQAIKCYESVGFKKGLKTEKVYKDQQGQWWNNIEMRIYKDEFLSSPGRH